MQDNNILQLPSTKSSAQTSPQQKPQRQQLKVITRLFQKLQARYRHKWTSDLQGDPALLAEVRDAWAEELAGLNAQQLQTGWQKMRLAHPEWPPTPMQFRLLCLPTLEEQRVPNAAQAYDDAVNFSFHSAHSKDKKIHPAVQMTLEQIPSSEWRNGKPTEVKKIFTELYKKVIKKAERGEIAFNDGLRRLEHDQLPKEGKMVLSDSAALKIENKAIQDGNSNREVEFSEEKLEENKAHIRNLLKTLTNKLETPKP